MGFYDEQITQRVNADNEAFEESFLTMAGAVMGRRISDALNSDRLIAADAIGEILKYYRIKSQEIPESMEDMNEVLEYLLRPSGIMRRIVNLDDGWYRDASGPMLGRRCDDGTLVALIPCGLNGYRFYDRKTGKTILAGKKSQILIEREAIAFYKPFPLEKMRISSLFRYILDQIAPADVAMLLASALTVTLVGMLMPYLSGRLFSDVLASGSTLVLAGMGIFMVCTIVSRSMFRIVHGLVTARISMKLDLSTEAATMMRILSLPADFFKDYSAGELSRRAEYLNALATQLVDVLISMGLTAVFSLLYITQIFFYAPALAAPALVITLLTLAVTLAEAILQMRVSREQMKHESKENGLSYQFISGIQKIRLAGAEKRAFARWGKTYSKSAALLYDPPMFIKTAPVITLAISLIGTMIMYYAAIAAKVSIAGYYAFNTAYGMVNGAFMAFAGVASTIAMIRSILETVRPIIEAEPEVSADKLVITSLSGGIELNNVTFRYTDDMPPILDNLSLKIHPGQYVAIVGRTGCGKSTLMRVLLGFETPQKGAVYYDGRDLKRIDLKSLRHKIGVVMQNGRMFTGDILSNITISAPWLTLDDAWEAAEIAGMGDDIRSMPMGMHTLISEGQGGISGGQRQRLLIARAIAPKPKILMFDEATSALDNLTQKQVSDALEKMNCTRIVIAHRLSTIKQCDRIIVLDQGHIIEDGNYEELIAKKGFFADLVSRQRLDSEDDPPRA
ncbi:MAG: NHLP bacteriocin export ABC transporter permease/ATPase subunit [Lachnospiraceae bacterium]|nr:NHLP bacteriocin export ABC transporter permease/ATPase subunit [Lachnospiraceae bacterium]